MDDYDEVSNSSTQNSDTQREELLKQHALDKKKIKLLKKALKEEIAQRQKYEADLEKATTKIIQMSKNLEEKEDKYLKLYQENVTMNEKLSEFSSNITSKNFIAQYRESKEIISAMEKQLDDSGLVHKELIYNKEEIIKDLERQISQQENYIKNLKREIENASQSENQVNDKILSLEQIIDEKDQMIEEYRLQIWQLKEDQMNKEQVIEALSNSLGNKGEEAAQLAQKLAVIKNQLIDAGTFDQRYIVQKRTKFGVTDRYIQFLRDTEEEGEFFLQITRKDGSKRKRIPVLLIEQIENIDGVNFNMIVLEIQNKNDNRFKNGKSNRMSGMFNPTKWVKMPFVKSIRGKQVYILHFESEHLNSIIESFKKVRLLALEKVQEQAEMVDELMKQAESQYEIVHFD
ncbi:UNKNOWN [Stylonychia lemnae]|uniref:Uncharacterized protein n=1 Tax=Stylonychia lemnae TaxID=5949 RepID=A0A078ACU6_STYLE|nr:UNKNOWN [Stylonychia lemnae]|eukprot:CDW80024.1 UNKNOWN [Stylonychia lemnae]